MALECPKCRHAVDPADLNVQADIAKCGVCGEVFRPSAALGGPPPAPTVEAEALLEPPPVDRLPEKSRIRVEEHGGTFAVRFPSAGFNVGQIFLIGFAIAWWSFLLVFVGFGVAGIFGHHDSAPAEADDSASSPAKGYVEWGSDAGGDAGGARDTFASVAPWFLLLFLTPFFLAGFAMLFGILWPLFGHTEVRIEGRDCLYRASLFGVGRTRRASRDETALRWIEEGFMPPGLGRWRAASQAGWLGLSDTCLFLTLGTWETPFGATVGRREQEWVYHALKRALQQR